MLEKKGAYMGRTSNLKFEHHNIYLLSQLRSKCEVLSATALESCQHGARCNRLRTSEGREKTKERKDEIERSKEMRKLTYKSCKITTSRSFGTER